MRILLDPTAVAGGGVPAAAPAAPAPAAAPTTPAAATPAPAAQPAAPTINYNVAAPAAPAQAAPATPQTVTIPLDQLHAYTTAQAQLAAMQEAQRAQQEAAQREQANLLMQKGQLEEGLRLLREQSEQAIAAERAKLADIETRAKSYALDGEVARAMAGVQFANEKARKAFETEVRSELLVEGQGTTFAVRTPTFQTPGQLVAAKIASGEYNFMLAPQGVSGTATPGQTTQSAPPAANPAAVAPAVQVSPNGPTMVNGEAVKLGVAWVMKQKAELESRQTSADRRFDPSRAMGFGAGTYVETK